MEEKDDVIKEGTSKKTLKIVLITVAIVVVIGACVAGYFFMKEDESKEESKKNTSNSTNTVNTSKPETNNNTVKPELDEAELKDYKDFEGEWAKIKYKKDWTYETTDLSGYESVVFLSPTGMSTVGLTKEDLPVTYTVEQYKNAAVMQLKNAYPDTIVEEKKTEVNGYDAYKISYDLTIGGITGTIEQTVIVKGKTAIIITFSGMEEGSEEVYYNMANTIEAI